MKILLLLACFTACANAISFYEVVTDEWNVWKLFHGKNYSNPVEDKFRLKIFMENKAKIAKHNAKAHEGHKSYFLKMNSFGDLVRDEIMSFLLLLCNAVYQNRYGIPKYDFAYHTFCSFTTNSLVS